MLNPYSIIAGILLLIAVAFGGAHVGSKLNENKWQKREQALLKQHNDDLVKAAFRYERMVEFNNGKARKASEDHAKNLREQKLSFDATVARERAAGGLRIPKSSCTVQAAGSTQTPGAGRLDGGARTTRLVSATADQGLQGQPAVDDQAVHDSVRLPEHIESKLFDLAEDAEKLATQLRSLQKWIRDAGLYGPATE